MSASLPRLAIERTLSQGEFDRFAKLSGDHNPIHVDPDFAARSRFGRTVSHGVLLYSILRGLAARLVPGARQTEQRVMFPAPTYADEPMRFEVAVTVDDGAQVTLAMSAVRLADGVETCTGEIRLLRIKEAAS